MKTAITLFLLILGLGSAQAKAFDADLMTGADLIRLLDHPDWHFRVDAAKELRRRELPEAGPKLVAMVSGDASWKVRRAALDAVVKILPDSVAPLARHLAEYDSQPGNRSRAIALLARWGDSSDLALLTRVLSTDSNGDVRMRVVRVLGKTLWSGAEAALASAVLEDTVRDVRLAAVKALARFADPTTRGALHSVLLEDRDVDLRRATVRAMERFPLWEDRDALVQALDDRDSHVARHAARALADIGDSSIVPVLRQKAMEARDHHVAREFARACSLLEGEAP